MKKGLMIIFIVMVSILGISFVSAGWFKDLFVVDKEGSGEGWLATLSGEGVIINDGETVTVFGGVTISVAIEDADTAAITIDGVTESKDEGWSGKIGTVDIYVKNVVGPNVAGTYD